MESEIVSDPVERHAKMLCKQCFGFDAWGHETLSEKEAWRRKARLAIAAKERRKNGIPTERQRRISEGMRAWWARRKALTPQLQAQQAKKDA